MYFFFVHNLKSADNRYLWSVILRLSLYRCFCRYTYMFFTSLTCCWRPLAFDIAILYSSCIAIQQSTSSILLICFMSLANISINLLILLAGWIDSVFEYCVSSSTYSVFFLFVEKMGDKIEAFKIKLKVTWKLQEAYKNVVRSLNFQNKNSKPFFFKFWFFWGSVPTQTTLLPKNFFGQFSLLKIFLAHFIFLKKWVTYTGYFFKTFHTTIVSPFNHFCISYSFLDRNLDLKNSSCM